MDRKKPALAVAPLGEVAMPRPVHDEYCVPENVSEIVDVELLMLPVSVAAYAPPTYEFCV